MLASAGNLTQLVGCATDQVRHNRMRDLTGGDALAVIEISTAQQFVLAQPAPDLTSLAVLAVQRDHLTDRNSNIPIELPAVWARIGQLTRAEGLVNSIPTPYRRDTALTEVARVVAAGGDHDRANALAEQITDPSRRSMALSMNRQVVVAGNNYDRATLLAREVEEFGQINRKKSQRKIHLAHTGIPAQAAADGYHDEADGYIAKYTNPVLRAWMLAGLAEIVAAGGDCGRAAALAGEAEALTAQITDPDWRVWTLTRVAEAVAAGGDRGRAAALAGEAELLTAQITDLDWKVRVLVRLARAVVTCGDPGWAAGLVNDAEVLSAQITDSGQREKALAQLAKAAAAGGDHDRAEALTRQVIDTDRRWQTLIEVMEVAATNCDHDRAVRLAGEAKALLGPTAGPYDRANVMTRLAVAVAASGDHDRAEALARQITDRIPWGKALIEVASVVGASGDRGRAARLIYEAETFLRQITFFNWDAAELAQLAEAVAASGDHDRAARLASEVEALTGHCTGLDERDWMLIELVKVVAAGGDYDRAEALTAQITEEFLRARALAELIEMVSAGGDRDRAVRLASEAERLTGQITDHYFMREYVRSYAAISVAASGDCDRAEVLIAQITDPNAQADALITLVKILVRSDKEMSPDPEHTRSSSPQMVRARRLLAEALVAGSWLRIVDGLGHVDPFAVTAIAEGLQARWGMNAATATEVQTADDHRDPGGSRRTSQWMRGLLRRVWG